MVGRSVYYTSVYCA